MPQPTITMNPQPPTVGDTVTVTYTGRKPTTLKVEVFPSGELINVRIDGTGTGTFVVPVAESLVIIDPSGAAASISSAVGP
jgi:hypothetical protein